MMRKSRICRVISAFTCFLSFVVMLVVLIRLVLRFFGRGESFLPKECCLVGFVMSNCSQDTLIATFTICGLVNFSLPYVINVRNTSLYGINLSQVISSQFGWNGYAYISYGILEIMGLYCATMNYLVSGTVCFVGVVLSFISTGFLAVVFVIRQDVLAVPMIERYLTIAAKRENETSKRNRLLQSGDYIQAFFEKNHAIPTEVVLGLLEAFEKAGEYCLPKTKEGYYLYTYSRVRNNTQNTDASYTKRDVYKDVWNGDGVEGQAGKLLDAVLMARAVCDRIFNGLEKFNQTILLRQLLHVLCTDLQQESLSQGDVPNLSTITSRDRKRSALFLCGLEAWRRQSLQTAHDRNSRLNCWEDLNDQILSADVYSVMDRHDQFCGDFRYALCLLIILSATTALAEAVSLNQELVEGTAVFWGQELELLRRYNIDIKDIADFFSWGQVVLLASGDPRYNPEKCYMGIIQLRTMLTSVLKQIRSIGGGIGAR